jgi:pimeloyl-ACP methyl ester carboxylesterase
MPVVKVNDINMYYEISGDGEPLVTIWGMGGEISAFADRLHAVAGEKYKVLLFDNRGTGRTDKPDEPYSFEAMAGDTIGLMDALGVRRTHVIGISMGSRIALALAARYPERVKSLILNVAAARSPCRDDPQAALAYERLRAGMTQPAVLAMAGRYPPTVESFLRLFDALKDFDGRNLLSRITAPTLIVNGTKDASTPVKFAEELRAGIPGARLILVEEDHMFIRTKPDLLLEPALDFMALTDAKGEPSA